MRLKFLLWLFLLALFLTGCASRRVYIAPVMPYELPEDVSGRTTCSWNNLPLALVQPLMLETVNGELTIIHEQIHAEDMFNYKGGCWPFYYRYRDDAKFRLEAEYRAYCVEGQAALKRNKNPTDVWNRIKQALLEIDAVLGEKKPNCIY